MVLIVTPLWWLKVEGAHAGIALSTALAGSLNAALLWRFLRRQGLYRAQPGWPRFALRLALACLGMVAVLLVAKHVVGPWQPLIARWRLLHLAWVIPLGGITYGV